MHGFTVVIVNFTYWFVECLQIGIFLGSIAPLRESFQAEVIQTLGFAVEFGMMCYMFVLGVEMNPYVLFKAPTRDAIVAYAGILSTFILACGVIPFMHYSLKPHQDLGLTLSLSITLSGSGSHILTRVITNLKIGKSDIGKLGIAAGIHSDMISMLMFSIGYCFFPAGETNTSERIKKGVMMGVALVVQSIIAAKVFLFTFRFDIETLHVLQ